MDALLTSASFLTASSILVAVLLDFIWPLATSNHPVTAMSFLADRMAIKVLPEKHSAASQHYISGSLGFVVLISPLFLILYFLLFIAEYQWFFHGVLLYLSLGFGSTLKQYRRVIQYIGAKKKLLARETLAKFVARTTDNLSDIGIAKAAIEALLLKYYLLFVGVIFWFVVAGGLGALFYRLVLEFSWAWHRRKPEFILFSRPIELLKNVLSLIPQMLGATAMLLVTDAYKSIVAIKHNNDKNKTSLMLCAFGGGLGISLGGPAYYFGNKIRFVRVGGNRQVKYSDMTYAKRAILRHFWLVITITSFSIGLTFLK